MIGVTFIKWYLAQLCPHPVEVCILAPGQIKCLRCCISMKVSKSTIEQYEAYVGVPEEVRSGPGASFNGQDRGLLNL